MDHPAEPPSGPLAGAPAHPPPHRPADSAGHGATDGLVRRHLRITGLVQGVFFRESTRREAERVGVLGWVRNLDGGGVEVVVEGSSAGVEALVAWCRHGPPDARVDTVSVDSGPATGEYTGFVVIRTARAEHTA